ncbi:MAG: hypothetical protein IPO25_00205 [Saprospiraceae bacterium]|nr:hypothetical protein [Saprospiraceae bacterium]
MRKAEAASKRHCWGKRAGGAFGAPPALCGRLLKCLGIKLGGVLREARGGLEGATCWGEAQSMVTTTAWSSSPI